MLPEFADGAKSPESSGHHTPPTAPQSAAPSLAPSTVRKKATHAPREEAEREGAEPQKKFPCQRDLQYDVKRYKSDEPSNEGSAESVIYTTLDHFSSYFSD